MKTNNTETVLLSMLRQRNEKLNIYYLTRESRFYKVLHIIFYVLFGICTAINLLSVLSWGAKLASDLSVLQSPTSVQQNAIAAIRDGIRTVSVFGILLIGAPVFSALKKSVPSLAFALIPSFILITTFASRLSNNIDAGNYNFFVFVHLLPLCLFMLSCLILTAIEINQKVLDKKGMEEIAERIYERYSLVAENITEQQWAEVLSEYKLTPQNATPTKKSKKAEKKAEAKTEV